MKRLWLAGLLMFGLTVTALSLHVPGALSIGTLTLKSWFVAITGVSAAVYLCVVLIVTRGSPSRFGIVTVLLVAVALRLPLIVSPSFLSTDIYRYVWDGRVQAAGINPYRYFPGNPVLSALRDTEVYPKINRAEYAPTIYPPMAQLIFAVTGVLWSSVTGVKAAMAGFEILAIVCLLRLLAVAGLPGERVAIYAWNPLSIWAFASDGHIDAAVTGLVAAALLLRVRHRDGWAGMVLGLAIATKFLPAVVAPVLWRRRTGWRAIAACLATIVALYALYSSVGLRIFGFVGGYGSEEGYDTGDGFWLLAGLGRVLPMPAYAATAYKLSAVTVLAVAAAWVAFIRRPDGPAPVCATAGVMMALLTVAISPHYPWYFAWLAVPCVLAPSPAVLWLSVSPILLYLDTFGDRFVWPSVVYVPAICLALASLRPPPPTVAIKGIS